MGIHVHMAYFSTYMYISMLYFMEVHLHMYIHVHVHVCVQYAVHIHVGYEYGSSYTHVHVYAYIYYLAILPSNVFRAGAIFSHISQLLLPSRF